MSTPQLRSDYVRHDRQEAGRGLVRVETARFQGAGGVEEIHLAICPTKYADFETQSDWVHAALSETLTGLGGDAQPLLLRYVCSDLANQERALAHRAARGLSCCAAMSWIEQPPIPPARLAVLVFAVRDPTGRLDVELCGPTFTWRRGPLQHLWSCRMNVPGEATAALQTGELLTVYEAELRNRGLSLADHLIRTWFFLRDIDLDYGAMVEARRLFFAARGLTSQTHYCASTGIGGRAAGSHARVTLDAYAIGGILPEQITYLRAPEHLSPTDLYGVTFERGLAIDYRDRRQVFISGTASIDDQGRVLHPGDLTRQLDRTLDNIRALLQEAGADWQDLCTLTAYVRDPSDAERVRAEVGERLGPVPLVVVTAAVCRPCWLVEVEAQAVVAGIRHDLPGF